MRNVGLFTAQMFMGPFIEVTSGSSFLIRSHYESAERSPLRFCAYCRQQKEALKCDCCGARLDLAYPEYVR